MTLGSLFDGIGGFPLAACRAGINPVWASEIEVAPISITKRHFPVMCHLGDITKINGGDIEPVDIISFGSPCQDLSISGLRAGLDGKRSGLFMQAVRVIKEMRNATNGKYPTTVIWENVPGAFSSNKGRDFKTVIQEIACIAEAGVSIPRPSEKSGWLAAGGIVGDCWSLAWRVLDSKYWGVPQCRKRIYLVADFTSRCAGEILFNQESDTGNNEKGENEGSRLAGNTESGDKEFVIDIGYSSDRIQVNPKLSVTLKANGGGNGSKTGLYYLPVTYCIVGNTIDRTAKSGGNGKGVIEETSYTLNTVDRHAVFTGFQDTVGCLCARDSKGVGNQYVNENKCVFNNKYEIRRLTPLECERLQGFPDGWTELGHDGKRISDNQRYKALGNSVAIPCVEFILRQIQITGNKANEELGMRNEE
jgi:DNA (cytosine-5)-methyltransferase 1